MGFVATDRLRVRDLWSKTELPDVTAAKLTADLPADGGHLMVSVQRAPAKAEQLLV